MTAATVNLQTIGSTGSDPVNAPAIEQGSTYTLILHFVQPEQWQLDVTDAGAVPNTWDLVIDGVTYSYTTVAGDTPELIVEGLTEALSVLCGKSVRAGVSVEVSGSEMVISGPPGELLEVSLSSTDGDSTVTRTQQRYVDLTGAALTAAVLPTGAAEVDWTSRLSVLSLTEGRVLLNLLELATALYTWTAGTWEMYADYGGGIKIKLVVGVVQVIQKVTGA